MEWQPIDTVPTLVPIQFLDGDRVYTGWYNPNCDEPDFPYHIIDEHVVSGWNGLSSDFPPSHWRELDTSIGEPPNA